MLSDLHLIRPWWLLALLPALLLALLLYRYRHQQSPWHNLIAVHLQQVLLGGQQLIRRQPFALPLLLLCWFISVLALAGPSWQKVPQPAFALKKATVLVLDLSMSMRATDMVPDRLTQQRFNALDFTDELAEGELALLAFAGDAFVISPLTPDHNNIRLLIPDLKPEIMPVQGSNLLAAIQQAGKLLQQAGYPRGDVVVFTDGFDNGSYRDIQDLLNNWPHRLSVLAFGSADGAPVQQENGELLKNAQGGVVIPKVPLTQLASLARSGGGVFTAATAGGNNLAGILALPALSPLDQADSNKQIQGDQWYDSAIYLVWMLLPLVLLQRKYSPLLALSCLMIVPRPATAFEWRDLWQTKQQQAVQDYNAGDFANAQAKFSQPLWQGNAAYRQGDYQSAEQAFRQAITDNDNPVSAWHNLGNSLAQQQRYEEALAAYQQALQQNADFSPAQQNADLMQQLMQQQQQQQQDQKQQQKGSDQQQQDNQQQQSQDGDDAEQQGDANEASADDQQGENAEQQQAAQPQQQEQQQQETAAAQPQQAEQPNSEAEQPAEQQKAVHEAWPDATPEQQQQLENLLRKVQDDPALLLRNKMYLEYLKRQQQRLPKGVDQQW
ncbi:MAG: VWA domain-containing protein [Gammaproteobacteria bacterium]|nr:VWA domain-containing protein [Gammaproteobacteria bacterium]MBU1554845.1 VWA domain-containing protein [Gammaproteobacteria bacterium]MBU2071796.1 VWA domain-containing protein [Gammaproteobacteria bacterium]MBU2184136.1 VWA domain-containing protein [Gammaproteobacteria bacterium]MBU2204289.1 VWA domain-containing protein [Gammaproteobacteria bacterium]